jgi:hypothetical protein
MSKSKANRKSTKYPALDPKVNPRIRRDYSDQDYIAQLSDKEKDWLNRFNEEYINANFTHKGKRIHLIKVKERKRKKDGHVHKIDVYKQQCEHANNARNRDAFAMSKSNNILETYTPIDKSADITKDQYEDELISKIDIFNNLKDDSE